jgi:B-cell receptor-associated protein 31
MIRIHREYAVARETGMRGDVRSETDWRSRKFLS